MFHIMEKRLWFMIPPLRGGGDFSEYSFVIIMGNSRIFCSKEKDSSGKSAASRFSINGVGEYTECPVRLNNGLWSTFGQPVYGVVEELYLDFLGASKINFYLNFPSGTYRYTKLSTVTIKNVGNLGAGALKYSFFGPTPHKLILENVIDIDDGFMQNSNYHGMVNLPEGLRSLGVNAFKDANNITEVYIPSTLKPPTEDSPDYFSTTNISAPAYVNGIKLSGSGADAWKSVLSNRTTSPYRKLL